MGDEEIDADSVWNMWSRRLTSSGMPYYVHTKREVSQWDHPMYARLFEDFAEFGAIKYAAYRTALKLRYLQKKLQFDLVDLKAFSTVLDRYDYQHTSVKRLPCENLVKIVNETCIGAKIQLLGSSAVTNDLSSTTVHLLVNWLLNICDKKRSGNIDLLTFKVAMGTLCNASLSSKYKFFFNQICDLSRCVPKANLLKFIKTMLQVAAQFGENSSFGGLNAQPAVDSCFSGAWSSTGVTEDEFLAWLNREPQTLVWLPTFHRMVAAEKASHEAKCNLCKQFPIVGIRYRCLKCFNCDVCQQCFLTGRCYKKHQASHPMQEYCKPTGAREDTRAFLKTLKNKLSKGRKQGLSYLPVPAHPPSVHNIPVGSAGQSFEEDAPESGSSVPPKFTQNVEELHNWRSAIQQLDGEYKDLIQTIHSCHIPPHKTSSSTSSSSSQEEILLQRNRSLEAEQEKLKEHNQRLEEELQQLKRMLHKGISTGTPKLGMKASRRFQSTPATARLSFHSPISIISADVTPYETPSLAHEEEKEEEEEVTTTFAESEGILAVTQFSVPSVCDSQSADSNDEQELKNILDKMEEMFSAETPDDKQPETLDEIYEAVNHIGEAFAAFSDKLST
ncbi:hypothetical protein CAPTEDRAFT_228293 [Capitella teleta]|uniref:Dystrophin n=1 Tax=Capitella teleta TaxID=283909 RepID=R7UR84_CAPTE|nr:hypothetical protein CAPTEDRAFT_228293 [Capitella teleta]|eukprot:ELU06442.1 hypothetical protein CAPTEDRAFT_228293 [Capitella teleta]